MPKAVSKRQWRFLNAILHGKVKAHPRGTPPKSVAAKYTSPGKDAPEQSGENRGGTWGEKHHSKAKEKTKEARIERKKKKAALHKAFEQYYNGRGAGVVIVNKEGHILVGDDVNTNKITFPGGHVNTNETFEEGAHREVREEANIVPNKLQEIGSFKSNMNDCKVFFCDDYKGRIKADKDEIKNLRFQESSSLADDERLRDCCKIGLKMYLESQFCHLKKNSLQSLVTLEKLEKNINNTRMGRGEAVLEVTHGDALRLVGNGAFRMIREATRDMQDESFKEIKLDNYIISIRKHVNDTYSGRIGDGHKMLHQFTNKSLPQLTAELMSVFEWYLPEDEPELHILDEKSLSDDAIDGGLDHLIEDYKRHNLANIYQEVENIREEIRHGNAVDLLQVEKRIMELFDKLEKYVHIITEKHNKLAEDAGQEIDELEAKLLQLQQKVDELNKRPTSVEAYASNPNKSAQLLNNDYCYLSKPVIEISPNGKIKITFSPDWNYLDQENFLHDMKARVIKKAKEKKKDD
jgi:ADP-ribose pyrophosphatase YjhB (NUDIX family)